jgi:hypothetical protein
VQEPKKTRNALDFPQAGKILVHPLFFNNAYIQPGQMTTNNEQNQILSSMTRAAHWTMPGLEAGRSQARSQVSMLEQIAHLL